MSPYRRAKREDASKPSKKELSISIGSVEDSFSSLKLLCNDKANEIIKSIELETGEDMEIVFWTADFPELIGVAKVIKNRDGLVSYTLDYSLNTLGNP